MAEIWIAESQREEKEVEESFLDTACRKSYRVAYAASAVPRGVFAQHVLTADSRPTAMSLQPSGRANALRALLKAEPERGQDSYVWPMRCQLSIPRIVRRSVS